MLKKHEKRNRRHKRVRAKVFGTVKVPRLCVFRSSQHIYCQLIDDDKGKVILSVNDFEIKKSQIPNIKPQTTKTENKEIKRTGKVAIAYDVGKLLSEKALKNKIKKVVFDRGGYKYHGRVKAIAEGARDTGLSF